MCVCVCVCVCVCGCVFLDIVTFKEGQPRGQNESLYSRVCAHVEYAWCKPQAWVHGGRIV